MAIKTQWTSLLTLSVSSLLIFACSDDTGTTGTTDDGTSSETSDTTTDSDTDETDTNDEDSTTDMTGDGDGDTDSGDGDGDDPTETDTDETDTDETDTDTEGDGDGDPAGDVCGDGMVTGNEACDDGVNDGAYGGCAEDCSALAAYCGDAELNGEEVCDDGVNDDAYGGCASDCAALGPYCGDAAVNGEEICDDGVNDGAYGGCSDTCAELSAFCGDGEINGPESCDDANDDSADGCLGSCEAPGSCLDIYNYDNALMDGAYMIDPEGNMGEPLMVHCDMLTDGGGYTFWKVNPQAGVYAVDAEAMCAERGMQLWIPRSEEHLLSGWAISNDGMIGPDASVNYMRILGIYSEQDGATCNLQPMNSDNENCGWGASDGEAWWVHERDNINEPNGDNTTIGSMYYLWTVEGALNHHNDLIGPGGNGYNSDRFMCDVGDKF